MSCISLRLPPARKAWNSFTSTLGRKLRKIRRSKAMKKPRKHLNTTTTPATRASKFLATTRRFRHKRLPTVRSAIYGFHKKPAPVYIDKLFKEPACDLGEHLKPQIAYNPRIGKAAKLPDQPGKEVPGSSKGGESDKPCTSDDMWESVALASPLMHGIDERAEEFIARFRGEMAAQEMLARNL